jgi:hypothetical protein
MRAKFTPIHINWITTGQSQTEPLPKAFVMSMTRRIPEQKEMLNPGGAGEDKSNPFEGAKYQNAGLRTGDTAAHAEEQADPSSHRHGPNGEVQPQPVSRFVAGGDAQFTNRNGQEHQAQIISCRRKLCKIIRQRPAGSVCNRAYFGPSTGA